MVKKVILLFPVLLGLLLYGMTDEEQADASAQLEQAKMYRKQGYYQQAEGIYQQIVTDYPGTDYTLQAQKGLTVLYLVWGKVSEAHAAYEQLPDPSSEHQSLAEAAHQVAYKLLKGNKDKKALLVYEHIVKSWSCDDYALWLQTIEAISNIRSDNDEAAEAAIETLLTGFSGHKDIAKAVNKIGDRYHQLKRYEKAREIFQYVVDNWPKAEYAIWSQKSLVGSSIQLGDDDATEAAIEKLITVFFEDERIAEMLGQVAGTYRKVKNYEKALELYQYVLDNWPDSEQAIRSQRGIVLSNIGLGDDPNTEAAIEKLINNYSGHKHLAEAVYHVARKLKDDAKAASLYQYIIENCPDSELAIKSEAKIGNINIRLGDLNAAQVILDGLLADYSGDPVLPKAVAVMGDGYYNQALLLESKGLYEDAKWYYQRAIVECERILTQLPEIPYTTAEACYFLAVCHERLGQQADAIQYYQMLVDNWPDFEYAWNALFKTGWCFEKLEKSGLISESEANPIIKAAYEQLLEEYPNCKMARHARRWLSRHGFTK